MTNPNQENIIDSCKSIIEFLVNENDQDVRLLKYNDFLHKFSFLQQKHDIKIQEKKKYDVILFVVVRNELEALDDLLKFKKHGNKKTYSTIHCWEYELTRNLKENSLRTKKLKLLIVFLGEAGDINCSIFCMKIYSLCECDLAVLSGIAAGYEPEITKNSVVLGNGIVDYEPQRIEKDHIIFRPNNYDPAPNVIRDIQYLETEEDNWQKYLLSKISEHQDKLEKLDFDIENLKSVSLKGGVIASGKKLIANDTEIQNLRNQLTYKKGIIAAEMEGGGFCPANKEFGVNWIVIRGISDYGGEDKNSPVNKKQQYIAAFSAMSATIYYLTNIFRRSDEDRDEEGEMFF